jgi:hypothetical protein
MILTVNRDSIFFAKHRQPFDLCNDEVLCFLYGTNCIVKDYLKEQEGVGTS